MAFIKNHEEKKICCVANLGDTRAVICTDKNIAKRVSIDHKVSNPSEIDRIRYICNKIGVKEDPLSKEG